jgi:hypothetical protein
LVDPTVVTTTRITGSSDSVHDDQHVLPAE